MSIKVISTAAYSSFDLIFGRVKNPDEEDQYTAVIVMYPPGSLRESKVRASQNRKQKKMIEIGRYIVETGTLDELSKYKELGVFSEWPFIRLGGWKKHKDIPQDLEDRDKKFLEWRYKMLKSTRQSVERRSGGKDYWE